MPQDTDRPPTPGITEAVMTLRAWIADGYPRRLRDAASMSQLAMAEEVGCAPQTINRWETGRHDPKGVYAVMYLLVLRQIAARPGMPAPPEPGGCG
jgi:DNA-binding XRE family transcriptional regulator